MDYVTRRELLELLITTVGLVVGIIIPVITLIVKMAVDKAKIQSMEGDKALDEHIREVRDNYLMRFDDLKGDIHEIKLLIEKKFNELDKKIARLE